MNDEDWGDLEREYGEHKDCQAKNGSLMFDMLLAKAVLDINKRLKNLEQR